MTCKIKQRGNTFKTYAEGINKRESEKQAVKFCGDCWGFHLVNEVKKS